MNVPNGALLTLAVPLKSASLVGVEHHRRHTRTSPSPSSHLLASTAPRDCTNLTDPRLGIAPSITSARHTRVRAQARKEQPKIHLPTVSTLRFKNFLTTRAVTSATSRKVRTVAQHTRPCPLSFPAQTPLPTPLRLPCAC